MFCPKCGKEGEGLCVECFLEEHQFGLKPVEILLCNCGGYRIRGQWMKDVKGALPDLVKKNLILPEDVEAKRIEVMPAFGKDRINLDVVIYGIWKNQSFTRKIQSAIKFTSTTCPDCSKRGARYYEAILQLRTDKKRPDVEIDPTFVSDAQEVRGGFDFYLTSTHYGREVARQLQDKGYAVKESSKLYGKKDGRDVYRMSISVREPEFSEGDFLEYAGSILNVAKMGRDVLCKDLSSGKKRMIPSYKLADSKVVARKTDLRPGVVTMVSPSEIQVLDLSNNKTYELKNSGLEHASGSEVKILRLKGKTYIL